MKLLHQVPKRTPVGWYAAAGMALLAAVYAVTHGPGLARAPGMAGIIAPAAPSSAAAPKPVPHTLKEAQRMLSALPEIQALSRQLERESNGRWHGALMQYDSTPVKLNGHLYFQISFVATGPNTVRPIEDFLVDQVGNAILVSEPESGRALSLNEWRATRPRLPVFPR